MDHSKKKIPIKSWYPVYTTPRAEKKVHARLQEKGIESYLPLQRVLKQWTDRKKWVEEPFFRSYVFVHINILDQASILQVPGVVRFIYFSGKPAAIRDDQVRLLKILTTSNEHFIATQEAFGVGESVEITGGPFAGFTGELIACKGQRLLIIRLTEINYNLLLEIDPALVKKKTTGER